VLQNGWAIEFIENPSAELQTEAIKKDACLILYIPFHHK